MEYDENFDIKVDGGELVIGLVAPIGVDLDLVTTKLQSYLDQYSYSVKTIHLSKLSYEFFGSKKEVSTQLERITEGMEVCSKLRKEYRRNDFFALAAIEKISQEREPSSNNRTVYIVRSFKHPDEVQTMKKVYGSSFYLTGITASKKTRLDHLKSGLDIGDESKAIELVDKDYSEDTKYGQNTRDVFQNSDVFIDIDDPKWDKAIGRFTDLIFGNPLITPTAEEHAMFMAYMASVRSGDLSRQVGAVITNSYNDVVSLGANDVPKFGGGQYWPDSKDKRDIVQKCDPNEQRRNEIILSVIEAFEGKNDQDESHEEKIKRGKKLLKDTGLLDLTEYGRAVHAEMEALLSAARNGVAVRDTTLFTTTFPCHNCAKHIVAAGLKRVKFIEPYPKSYATKLHDDSIDVDSFKTDDANQDKVLFEPFVGVGPRRYLDLFSLSLGSGRKVKRKANGVAISWSRVGQSPKVQLQASNYIDFEKQYCDFFSKYVRENIRDHSEDPICKECDSIMIKRVAKRGTNKGKEFWGCSKFPHCRYSEAC